MTDDMTSPVTAKRTVLVLFLSEPGEDEMQEVFGQIRSIAPGVELVDGASWKAEAFPAAGSYDAFSLETATGKRYRDREPHFTAFIVVGEGLIDQQSGGILVLALDVRKPVYRLSESGKLAPVTSLIPSPIGFRAFPVGHP